MTEPKKPRRRMSRALATTLADILGILLLCGGVAAIYWPAALILAGLATLGVSFIQGGRR